MAFYRLGEGSWGSEHGVDLVILLQNNAYQCYIDVIKNMYECAIISVCILRGTSSEFAVTMGLHQWLDLFGHKSRLD